MEKTLRKGLEPVNAVEDSHITCLSESEFDVTRHKFTGSLPCSFSFWNNIHQYF